MKYRIYAVMIVVAAIGLGAGACQIEDADVPPGQEQDDSTGNEYDTNDGADAEDRDANGDDVDGEQNSQADSRVADLVTSDDYDRLVIEVDFVEGRQTRDGIAEQLAAGLDDVIDKPAGIDVEFDDQIAEAAPEDGWTFDAIRDQVDDHRDREFDDETLGAYTLLLDGEYADSQGTVLGIAWANQNVVLFQDQIEEACQGVDLLPGLNEDLCENAELTVWRHEMGHVLGLVDNGAPLESDHEDEEHARHCKDEDCVMYWSYRRPDMVDRLADQLGDGVESVPDFDDTCRDDLDAVQ